MIHIRARRTPHGFVEMHFNLDLDSNGESVDFPGCRYITVRNLDSLITTLQDVQRFMANEPEADYRKWEVA